MSIHLAPAQRVSLVVTALFPDRTSAEHAWNAVMARGYNSSEISAVIAESTHKKHFKVEIQPTKDKALEGAGIGGAIGTTVGALTAAFVAVGSSLLLPGVGLLIAGPIVAAFVGAGAGGAVGSIIGAMVGKDIPEKHVKLIEDHISKGGIVLTVKARSFPDAEAIEMDWKKWSIETI